MNIVIGIVFWIIIVIIVLSLLHHDFLPVMQKETIQDVSYWVKTFEGVMQ